MAVLRPSLLSVFLLLCAAYESKGIPQAAQPAPPCPEFTCQGDGACLKFENVCDGYPHCKDASDEACFPQTTTPPPCEDRLVDCFQHDHDSRRCQTQPDWANLLCRKYCNLCGNNVIPEGSVRVAGSDSSNSRGRVEIFFNGRWGTVCDNGWEKRDAMVVCRQLGFRSGHAFTLPEEGSVRLVGSGASASQGRVEVFKQGQWGTVYGSNSRWNTNSATVVCRQLGFTRGTPRLYNAHTFGRGSSSQPVWITYAYCAGSEDRLVDCRNSGPYCETCSSANHVYDAGVVCSSPKIRAGSQHEVGQGTSLQPIWLDNLQCKGCEERLDNCTSSQVGQYATSCTHLKDASVECSHTVAPDDFDVRLVGKGATAYQGRVEVFYKGMWGTICNNKWETADAQVICRQLGFTGSSITSYPNPFGVGDASQKVWFKGVTCSTSHVHFAQCSREETACSHSADVGVVCNNRTVPEEGSVRLVGSGATVSQGRVEIFRHGQWGTMYGGNSNWNKNSATVVCRQLGFTRGRPLLYNQHTFGKGSTSQPIWINYPNCAGCEDRLVDCPYNSVHCYTCSSGNHQTDAGVVCSSDKIRAVYNRVVSLHQREGVLTSPMLGTTYHPNARVTYEVHLRNPARRRMRVSLAFERFQVEVCGAVCCDRFTVGGQEFCGNQAGKHLVVETSDEIFSTEFFSDATTEQTGFVIKYKAHFLVDLEATQEPVVRCDQALQDARSGFIVSPFYPGLVKPGYKCYHRLLFPTGSHTVRLEFQDFGFHSTPTACSSDYLSIPAVGKFCGLDKPNYGIPMEQVVTTGKFELTSVFTSRPVIGYVINFTVWRGLPSDGPESLTTTPAPPPTTTAAPTSPPPPVTTQGVNGTTLGVNGTTLGVNGTTV